MSDLKYCERNNSQKNKCGTITLRGNAEIGKMPDTAYINLIVNTFSEELHKISEQNATVVKKVVDGIAELGVLKSDIVTSGYNLNPNYEYNNNVRKHKGYNVNYSLRIKLTDFDLIGKVVDIAGANGVNQINGIEFILKNNAEVYNEALALALTDARKKAAAILKTEGCKAGDVLEIKEIEQHSYATAARFTAFQAADSANASTTINASQISVKAAVDVVFAIAD